MKINIKQIINIFKHLRKILIHKYWVCLYCFKCGLYWRGLVHDLSKFPITIPDWKKESNVNNQFQGKFKTGLLEIRLLQRAFDRHNIINTCQEHKISPRLVVTHTDLIDKNVINSFTLDNNIINFNNTEEALDILIKELDGYLDPQEVYYSDNPNSDIKQYI